MRDIEKIKEREKEIGEMRIKIEEIEEIEVIRKMRERLKWFRKSDFQDD